MDARSAAQRIVDNVERVIIGKREQVELAVITLMCGGHLLVEDVPGVGKTMLARSLARSSGCSFIRIQFTPDLLPTDITGVSIYDQKSSDFQYRPGPLLSQVVLADEINRATPKTQSALLEAMEERQITVDGVTHETPRPFMVMATQNPIEYEGTFPLPEAQLDRFLIRLELGYPSAHDEVAMMDRQLHSHPLHELEQVCGAESVLALQAAVQEKTVEQLEIERFGAPHADVGGYLLGLWGLPQNILEAVAYHHDPTASADMSFTPLTAVHVANALCASMQEESVAPSATAIDRQYVAQLGLEHHVESWFELASEGASLV